jgi:hypothetical protein
VLFPERLVEFLKPFVLGGESAFRCCVHDQHDLALVLLERYRFAFLCSTAVLVFGLPLELRARMEGLRSVLSRGLKS